MGPTPYPLTNAVSDLACEKHGRKPMYALDLTSISPDAISRVWDEWKTFTGKFEEVKGSVVLIENYGYEKVAGLGGEDGMVTAFPYRDCRLLCRRFGNMMIWDWMGKRGVWGIG
jgi:hypothetical protein